MTVIMTSPIVVLSGVFSYWQRAVRSISVLVHYRASLLRQVALAPFLIRLVLHYISSRIPSQDLHFTSSLRRFVVHIQVKKLEKWNQVGMFAFKTKVAKMSMKQENLVKISS